MGEKGCCNCGGMRDLSRFSNLIMYRLDEKPIRVI